jgi:hypothetical protein
MCVTYSAAARSKEKSMHIQSCRCSCHPAAHPAHVLASTISPDPGTQHSPCATLSITTLGTDRNKYRLIATQHNPVHCDAGRKGTGCTQTTPTCCRLLAGLREPCTVCGSDNLSTTRAAQDRVSDSESPHPRCINSKQQQPTSSPQKLQHSINTTTQQQWACSLQDTLLCWPGRSPAMLHDSTCRQTRQEQGLYAIG